MFKCFILILLGILNISIANSSPYTTWGPNNAPPFNVITISTGSSYTVQSLNALETNIFWNSNSGSAKALTLKGCTSADKGNKVLIWDQYGDAGTNNITITPSSGTINSTSSIINDGNYNVVSLVCDGVSNWNSNTTIGGATSTDVRNNTLYTPPSCDGFRATDGAISVGSSNFSSASASFVPGDTSKKITVSGAGPTQFLQQAAIVGGGAGHSVGEEITLSGGTGTSAKVVVREVAGGVITKVAGLSGTLGSYTIVPANPVSAGDATLNVTWNRDNLVTTIQSVTNSHNIVLAANASATVSGAIWAYGTDVAPAINALSPTSSVQVPKGTCLIGSSINIDNFYNIKAQGRAGYTSAATTFLWGGPVGGVMLSADSGARINGAHVGGFNLDAMCSASTGARFWGTQFGDFDVAVINAKDYGVNVAGATSGLDDNFNNDYRLVASVPNNCAYAMTAFKLDWQSADSGHGPNTNLFHELFATHADGNCLDLVQSYSNVFRMVQCYRGAGNGWGVYFRGSDTLFKNARQNYITYLFTQAPVLSDGGALSKPAVQNRIDQWDNSAYPAIASIGSGSTLYCRLANGNNNQCTPYGFYSAACGSPTGTATAGNYVAMGCAATITPQYSGKINFSMIGAVTNNTATGGAIAALYYGTGTPPANGDNIETAPGAQTCGGFPVLYNTPSTTFIAPIALNCSAISLTRGTTYWFDIGLKKQIAGTASVSNTRLNAQELP